MANERKTFAQYAELIKGTAYHEEKRRWVRFGSPAKSRTKKIKAYFKDHAGLSLDAIEKSHESTWEKALTLAAFVAKNIPHDNQKAGLKKRNAVSLWEYARQYPTGFNCRWHAILLSELLLAAGIKNCFVTCLPEDKNDNDCHVVNLAWLPERNKWAMLDSDMTEYAADEKGVPLSLREMREAVRDGRAFSIRPLPGFEDAWIGTESGREYMRCYWAKNLYWFARHTSVRYDLESGFCFADRYICLVPAGYQYDRQKFGGLETTDESAFWDI